MLRNISTPFLNALDDKLQVGISRDSLHRMKRFYRGKPRFLGFKLVEWWGKQREHFWTLKKTKSIPKLNTTDIYIYIYSERETEMIYYIYIYIYGQGLVFCLRFMQVFAKTGEKVHFSTKKSTTNFGHPFCSSPFPFFAPKWLKYVVFAFQKPEKYAENEASAMYIYIYVYIYREGEGDEREMYTYICMYICICMYLFCACVCVCVCALCSFYLYVCIYIFILKRYLYTCLQGHMNTCQ